MTRTTLRTGLTTLVVVLALGASTPGARAAPELTPILGLDDVGTGRLLFEGPAGSGTQLGAPLLETKVEIRVTGMIARTKVTQRFTNPTQVWLEGTYVFPLPEKSAVDRLRMVIGERTIEGLIQEREAAERTYEAAKREGKKASLVSQHRPNIFSTEVANIGPGEHVSIEIGYQETVRYRDGRFQLRFPLVVMPRYVPPDAAQRAELSGSGFALTPPSANAVASNPVSFDIILDAGLPVDRVESPYHAVDVVDEGEGKYRIRLAEGRVPADRDFVLEWAPRIGSTPQAAFFSEVFQDETYTMLMVLPPQRVAQDLERLPRETVLIIDTSGSMAGASMEQAKGSLLAALDLLAPSDHFNVIAFSDDARALFGESRIASKANLAQAIAFVSTLHADGGTNMGSALAMAFRSRTRDLGIRQIIFMTDGAVGNEADLFGFISKNLGTDRLFTVGIGAAPNSHFMSGAAKFGRGTYTYIGNANEVEAKMRDLFVKVSSPVLTELRVDWHDTSADVWPRRLPDLYATEPLIVTARLARPPKNVDVVGRVAKAAWQRGFDISGEGDDRGIHKLWAREMIAGKEEAAVISGDDPKAEILAVALRHGLVSKYTSLVAVDTTPTKPRDELAQAATVPVRPPHGSPHAMMGGSMPQGATPGALYLALGAALLAVSAIMARRKKEERSW